VSARARVTLFAGVFAVAISWSVIGGYPGGERKPALPERTETTLQAIRALPYLPGYAPAPERSGVTVHERGQAHPGFNLYVSGHGPEANLIDMDGEPLHRWRYRYDQVWGNQATPRESDPRFWRRAQLLEDGGLLAIFEGIGVVELDRDSNLRWAYRGNCHHDLFADRDSVYVLTRDWRTLPRIHAKPILDDSITILDAGGTVKRRISIADAFLKSAFAPAVLGAKRSGDIFHTNTIEVLDGRLAAKSPAFRRGNLLVSILYLDMIAVIDTEKEEVVWTLSGLWKGPHQPTVLDNGHLLVFDNNGLYPFSRVLEVDPFSQEIAWEYRDAARPFHTLWCGSNQRLRNGNTLITETDHGRAFEVTPQGKTVWEFLSPHRIGEKGDVVAALFEMTRIEGSEAAALGLPAPIRR
jgi:hypothetical protein